MNHNKGFTLIELLAVIVILAIVLAIAIPSITSIINSTEKSSFVSSTKLLINAVKIKLLEDSTFDITTINKSNLKTKLNISDENYSFVLFTYDSNGKIYANVEGTGKWASFITCGNYDNISTNDLDCIVKDGLVLNLDAGNKSSYSGSGTTWYDLSGKGNNGTLVNGVGYNSYNSGSMTFDGSNDYVNIPNSTSLNFGTQDFTASCFLYIPTTILSGNKEYGIINKNANAANTAGWGFEISTWGQVSPYNKMTIGFYNTGQSAWGNSNVVNWSLKSNVWNEITVTRNSTIGKLYVNGVLVVQKNHNDMALNVNNTSALKLSTNSWGPYFNGKIANVKLYNRALSATEIQQNYNGLKGRYGL